MIRGLRIGLCLAVFMAAISAHADRWNEYRSQFVSVLYKDIPFDFVRSVGESADENFRQISGSLGFNEKAMPESGQRIKIYIYANDQEYLRNARPYEWSNGIASAKDKTIRTFPSAHGFFDSTLPHELAHIIFHEHVGFDIEVPLWFEEGVAMYQEKAKRFGVHAAVLDALENGQFISLTDLTNMRLYNDSPPERVQLFYAESASVVNYLIGELGQSRFMKLCRELKSGKSFSEALESSYVRFSNYDDLSRAWIGYLQTLQ